MKVLLQDKETQQYAKSDGSWTDEHEATDFKTPLDAMSFCELHHLSHTSLVIWEDGKQHEMPLRCDE